MENPDLPLFPSEGPFKIKERVKFPGLYFAYIVGVLQPEHVDGPPYKDTSGEKERMVQTYGSRLRDMQFIYPEPEDLGAKHGKCACAWFADRGEWMYALEQTQRNAYLPQAFPTWLRTLSRQLQTASKKTRFVGNGFNCCLISYGISSSWTYGEDPWHRLNPWLNDVDMCVSELFIGEGVRLTLTSDDNKVGLQLDPTPGSIVTWRGRGWRLAAQSRRPFFRVSFRIVDALREDQQKDAKMPHRLRDALYAEKRVVPMHLDAEQYEDLLRGSRPRSNDGRGPHIGGGNIVTRRVPMATETLAVKDKESDPPVEPAPKRGKKAPPPKPKK